MEWSGRARVRFVQAAWVVLLRLKSWDRYGLARWIEAAKKRLHHNVLAVALANKLARMAWAVLNKERNFEVVSTRVPLRRTAGPYMRQSALIAMAARLRKRTKALC
jgi:hypothetical protein